MHQIVLIVLDFENDGKYDSYIKEIQDKLLDYRVLTDSLCSSLGKRLYYFEKLGVPMCIIIGPQELKERLVSVKMRIFEDKKVVSIENLIQEILKLKELYISELLQRSSNFSKKLIKFTED
ncbi:hypothetical protein PVNG_02374 [Plasmodium vivax North Korean]|uniref:Anticodon-binding domain-containing protein n=1 Tax=Plasmodium vivax North Korean TaxID=1035514 RepID=A0A0J9TM44_PLAVI|nr:hypothetical protein PVNG_02374 [Plasmodium vivax North Korean]